MTQPVTEPPTAYHHLMLAPNYRRDPCATDIRSSPSEAFLGLSEFWAPESILRRPVSDQKITNKIRGFMKKSEGPGSDRASFPIRSLRVTGFRRSLLLIRSMSVVHTEESSEGDRTGELLVAADDADRVAAVVDVAARALRPHVAFDRKKSSKRETIATDKYPVAELGIRSGLPSSSTTTGSEKFSVTVKVGKRGSPEKVSN